MSVKYSLFFASALTLAASAHASAPAPADHADHAAHAGHAVPASAEPAPQPLSLATAALKAADGSEKGLATLTSTGGKIELRVTGMALPAGDHGVHLHAIGRCDAPDFASAGGHLNPHAKMHGAQNPKGSHLGDLPNLTVASDGKGSLAAAVPGTPADVEANVFDADGTAVVVHAGPDDYKTDPSGNSGGRIACGILVRPG